MLHPRKLSLGSGGIGLAKVVGYYQTQDRITQKFEGLVMELPRLILSSGSHLFMGP
jgi:hypothetical protein